MTDAAVVLRARGVWKRFPGTQALRDVTIELRRGEVHALLGGNGSGKSTLIKILAGVLPADHGVVDVDGATLDARRGSPRTAHALGLRFVHQEDDGFGSLSVAENLAASAGFPHDRFGRIKWGVLHRNARELLDYFQIAADPHQRLDTLRPATARMISIARALQDRGRASAGVLVLDEPSAALPAPEVALLHGALRRYAAAGQAILYVTHRLDELERFADRATVLRDGVVVGSLSRPATSHERLVELIVGEKLRRLLRAAPEREPREARLEVRRCTAGPLVDVSFVARRGEVLGVAGLGGSGRTSLLQAIFGVLERRTGDLFLDGVALPSGRARAHDGVAYVPENRGEDAAFAGLRILENLSAASLERYGRRFGWRRRAEREDGFAAIDTYRIGARGVDQPFASLSGGNQQRAVLARWLRRDPAMLLLDEPSQGVDVGARADVHELVRAAAARGAVTLLVSSDFEELAALSDRVLVLRRGRIVAELEGADVDPHVLERLSHGTAPAS